MSEKFAGRWEERENKTLVEISRIDLQIQTLDEASTGLSINFETANEDA